MKPRRKAIDCRLIEPSKTSPGYFKYQITIEEANGKIQVIPSYGLDMQDAIDRLILTEKYNSAAKSKTTPIILLALLLIALISIGFISSEHYQLVSLIAIITISTIIGFLLQYLQKWLNK